MRRAVRLALAGLMMVALSFGGATVALLAPAAEAHPGGLDSKGCHTCRTNCAKWGLRTGEYHCHNGSPTPPPPPAPAAPPPPPPPAPPAPPAEPTTAQLGEIRRLYLAYFEREPDSSGIAYWGGLYANGRGLSAISQQFAQSAEFVARYGSVTNEGFVRLVYGNVLGREPDGAGLSYWAGMMAQGRSRGWVMIGFSNSAEFTAKTSPGGAPTAPLVGRLSQLRVAPESAGAPYDRDRFPHWIDADRDGCDTRCEVLARQRRSSLPGLPSGGWISVYEGYTTPHSSELDIDHMVPLAEAWRSGAWSWTDAQRRAFANDLDSGALLAVTAATNRSKSDRDPASWQPPATSAWCDYANDWIAVKVRWNLTAQQSEVDALANMLKSC